MISHLSRFQGHLLEGFSGEYLRPDGGAVHFSLCLNDGAVRDKKHQGQKRQTLIEAQSRAKSALSPQVYVMPSGLDNQTLSAAIKQALQDGVSDQPVFIEVSNKVMFAKSCEILGLSRRSLIELAGSAFAVEPEKSKQAHGGFHRLMKQIYDEPHLPVTNFEYARGEDLRQLDDVAYDYATFLSEDLKYTLPAAQKFVLSFGEAAYLRHQDGDVGRYYRPQEFTAIEASFKTGSDALPKLTYLMVLLPSQFSNGEHDFDIAVLLEDNKKYSLLPVMISVRPNEQLNNADIEYRPFINDDWIQAMNGENNNFHNLCNSLTLTALSALEWINSPNAKRIAHEPKQNTNGKGLAEQFAEGGKRPFFSSIEVKIPDEKDHLPTLREASGSGTRIQGVAGLQSITAHWQRYGANKEIRFKQSYMRGNSVNGVSAHIGVGGQEPA